MMQKSNTSTLKGPGSSFVNANSREKSIAIEMAQGSSSTFHKEWVIKAISNFAFSSHCIFLDFGSGKGELIKYLQEFLKISNPELQAQIVGADLLEKPMNIDCQWLREDLNKPQFDNLANKVDLVFAIEIIEHLENPREAIRKISEVLKPGGKLVLTTPNLESIRSIISFIFRGNFVDFLDSSYPAHITPIVKMDLERILSETAFLNITSQYSEKGVLPRFTNLTWQQISFGQLKGKRYSDHIMICAEKTL